MNIDTSSMFSGLNDVEVTMGPLLRQLLDICPTINILENMDTLCQVFRFVSTQGQWAALAAIHPRSSGYVSSNLPTTTQRLILQNRYNATNKTDGLEMSSLFSLASRRCWKRPPKYWRLYWYLVKSSQMRQMDPARDDAATMAR